MDKNILLDRHIDRKIDGWTYRWEDGLRERQLNSKYIDGQMHRQTDG
jgi:hypothetical protein